MGFLSFGIIDVLNQLILRVEIAPANCRLSSSEPRCSHVPRCRWHLLLAYLQLEEVINRM